MRMKNPAFFEHEQRFVAGEGVLQGGGSWMLPLSYFRAPKGFGEEVWIPSVPDTLLALRLSGSQVQCERPQARRRSEPGRQFALQPKGTSNYYRADGPIEFAQMFFPEEVLNKASDHAGTSRLSGLLRDDLVFVPDAPLHNQLREYVARGLDTANPATSLEMDGRALLLLDRLLALHHERARVTDKRPALASWQVKRLCDYMEMSMEADVRLDELAGLLGLSSSYTCRAFTAAVGTPPHRWLQQRRIERACELLATTNRAVADIALDVGMTPPAFSRAFRQTLGATPTEYRAQSN